MVWADARARESRILVALLLVWVLSAFDLVFTMTEAASAHFVELNPIAALLLDGPPHLLFLYKFGMLGVGTLILYRLRTHSVAELGCWFLLAATAYVILRWYVYYHWLWIDPPTFGIDLPEVGLP